MGQIKKIGLIELGKPYFALTSALSPGSPAWVSRIVDVIVEKDYCSDDPLDDVRRAMTIRSDDLVFMTAVESYRFGSSGPFTYFLSAGVEGTGKHAGRTINIGLFYDGQLSVNALVELVKVVTEAKCGTLMDMGLNITGTVTDAVAVGSTGIADRTIYAGTGTQIGSLAARIVSQELREALRGQRAP